MSFVSAAQLLQYGEMINLGINATNLGVGIWSELKRDPNNPQLLAELRRLVNAAEFNNEASRAHMSSMLSVWQNMQNEAHNTNEVLQSMAHCMKSYGKPTVVGQVFKLGGLLTDMAAVVEIKRLADNTEMMAGTLQGIENNLSSINSRGDYFPQHVYSYVRMMIERHAHDDVPHYFFVFHEGHEWHPKFEDLRRQTPLGHHFVGYQDDLDQLCAFLVEEFRPRIGTEPVLHILMPTVKPLAITESLTFPDAMRPFCIEGQKGEGGVPFVFMCTPLPEDRQHMKHIGALQPKPREVLLQRLGPRLPIIGNFTSKNLEQQFFEQTPWYKRATCNLGIYTSVCCPCDPILPRILGRVPVHRTWQVSPEVAEEVLDNPNCIWLGLLPVIETAIE